MMVLNWETYHIQGLTYLQIHISTQYIFVFIPKFKLYIIQKFIDIRKLKNFLIRDDKHQFEFIIQFVLENIGAVFVAALSTSFLGQKRSLLIRKKLISKLKGKYWVTNH